MLNQFADELKEIRISKNLSLQQVSVKTRIDPKFLEAMELGDFEFLPELYVKSFLKEYIKALGLDEKLYMKKYEASRTGQIYEENAAPPPPEPPKKENKHEEKFIPEKQVPEKPEKKLTSFDAIRNYRKREEESSSSKRRRQKLIYYVTTGLVVAASIIYLLILNKSDEIIIPEKSWEEVIEETKQKNDDSGDISDSGNQAVIPAGDSLNLIIRASDTSWIKIIIDDSRTEEFILFPGSQKSLKSSSNYKITIGNSGGIKLDLNNKPLNFRLNNNSVQRILIDTSGVKDMAVAEQ